MGKLMRTGLKCLILISSVVIAGCGGTNTGPSGLQYTLNVEGSISISQTPAAQVLKLDTPTPQVMIGTMLVETTSNELEELGINILNTTIEPRDPLEVDLKIELRPGSANTGVIFKVDEEGFTYGDSYLDLNLVASSTSDIQFLESADTTILDEGQYLDLGFFSALADFNDRTRIPLLDEVPIINFLYRGERHQASVTNLIVILTPQIIDATD